MFIALIKNTLVIDFMRFIVIDFITIAYITPNINYTCLTTCYTIVFTSKPVAVVY